MSDPADLAASVCLPQDNRRSKWKSHGPAQQKMSDQSWKLRDAMANLRRLEGHSTDCPDIAPPLRSVDVSTGPTCQPTRLGDGLINRPAVQGWFRAYMVEVSAMLLHHL